MTRVLRSTIAPQPAPGSIVADTDGTAWTRHQNGGVDRWYGCAPTDRGRPTMLARTWETLAASGDLTVLSEPGERGIRSEWTLNGHPLDDLAAIPNDRLQGITTPKVSPLPLAYDGQRTRVLRSINVTDVSPREAAVLYEVAQSDPADPDWHSIDVVAAYRRGVQDGSTRAA